MQNIPLFAKHSNGFCVLRKTTGWSEFTNKIHYNSKLSAVCLKTDYYSHDHAEKDDDIESIKNKYSIEFRINDVIDHRIVAYYIALLLAVEGNYKFKKTTTEFRNFLKTGITKPFKDKEGKDISVKEIQEYGYKLQEKDKIAMRHNSRKLVRILKDKGFPNYAGLLESYIQDNKQDLYPNI